MRLRSLIALLMFASFVLAPAARAQSLYWIDTNYGVPTLNRADAVGNAISSLAFAAGRLPEGLALDGSGNLYWTEAIASGARVQRIGPNLAGLSTLVSGGSALRGIAVDVAGSKLYWTTSNLIIGSFVRRSALDGTGFTNLIALGSVANLRGIAVDHTGGKIYWADFDRDAIFRANLDGTSPEQWLVLTPGSRPYGVAFDPIAQRIYWSEYATGQLRRISTAGGVVTLLLSGLANPTYLALDPASGQMYWSEGGAGAQKIYRGPMNGGSKTMLPLPPATYGGLAFQPNGQVSAPPPSSAPLAFALAPLAPNPSSGPVRAAFTLPKESHVRLSVIDLQGREVAVLADGTYPEGLHEASWDMNTGTRAPAGIYFMRMVVGERAWTRRFVTR